MESVRTALQAVILGIPASLRALAREAGLSHSALQQAAAGEIRLKPEKMRWIVQALQRWSRTTAALADRLDAALEAERKERE